MLDQKDDAHSLRIIQPLFEKERGGKRVDSAPCFTPPLPRHFVRFLFVDREAHSFRSILLRVAAIALARRVC